ncbi:hypothetical protein LOKO_01628 [Halomonas chromatireducens]|uniref:Uncharacterized protein n=1 Tax=Halomonas chromatireducens TaxID=507626 RepID=A0A109ULL0_9GAMM|nr:hypothetical protein LOKO_01628 [Halomonas chromatireducens]
MFIKLDESVRVIQFSREATAGFREFVLLCLA